jgi:hypothetical protein
VSLSLGYEQLAAANAVAGFWVLDFVEFDARNFVAVASVAAAAAKFDCGVVAAAAVLKLHSVDAESQAQIVVVLVVELVASVVA